MSSSKKSLTEEAISQWYKVMGHKTRDPGRIVHVLHSLQAAWIKEPDTRLGQLISNITHEHNLFNLEDEDFLRMLEKYLERRD